MRTWTRGRTLGTLAAFCALAAMSGGWVSAQDQKGAGRGGRGAGGGGQPGMGMMGGGADIFALAALPSVAKELGLKEEQTRAAAALTQEFRGGMREAMQGLGAGGFERMAEIRQDLEKEFTPKLEKIVGEAGIKRLREIELQMMGGRALGTPRVQEALKITASQREELASLTRASMERTREAMAAAREQGGGDFAAMREAMQKINEEVNKEMMAVLTDEQKKAMEGLTGKAVNVEAIRAEMMQGGGQGRRRQID